MNKLKVGREFFVAAFIALICSMILLCIMYQEDHIDKACSAIENYNQDAAKENIDKIWFIDTYGSKKETMLMTACRSGNGEMIKYLIDHGADINYVARGQLTPLELFCRDGYESGKDVLLTMLNARVRQSNYTDMPAIFQLAKQFYWMTEEQKEIATEEAILLLQYGAPMSYGDTSLLHLAAKGNMGDLFYTMVHTREGLYLMTMQDGEGNTPWEVAVNNGAIDVQRVIRSLEDEYKGDMEGDDVLQPVDPTEPPLGSVDNPYPDGYFDEEANSSNDNSENN